ncbi:hypothetical protein OROGR_026866 [Orobanche gracilis]
MEYGETETIFLFLLFLQVPLFCNSVPLSTNSRWIVNETTGKRVKLACVNWASHLEPMIAEGLEKKPVKYIAGQISRNGFNCVRFTWATYMFTRPDYYRLTVSQSLDRYNLTAAKDGVARNNPQFLKMKIREAHQAVVNELGRNSVMVVLDNHVSRPKWCCGYNDGDGFFGDTDFDPFEWLKGLRKVARAYKGNSAVVGMSLRNELRGKLQNEASWYKYMRHGANTVHNESSHFLVIISGLSSDKRLGFLRKKSLGLKFNHKLVYEAHWYRFGINADEWISQTNNLCDRTTKAARNNYLFLTTGDNAVPLILSEFGGDQSGNSKADDRYISCLLAEVAGKDIDWALWAYQGSYMLRHGRANFDEAYGVMDFNWNRLRNPDFLRRLQLIRHMNQGYRVFGECVQIGNTNDVILASCKKPSRWDQHQDGGPIKLAGSPGCLEVAGDGGTVTISNHCSSNWKGVSSSGLHLAAQNRQGEYLCLEKNASNSMIVTRKCLCVGDDLADLPSCADNPQVQWFKFVPANVE